MRIKDFLPQSLLGRTTLIVVFPFIVFQLIILSYYYNSLWERTLHQLSRTVVQEISLILNLYNSNSELNFDTYEDQLKFEVKIYDSLPDSVNRIKLKEDIIYETLRDELKNIALSKVYIDEIRETDEFYIILPSNTKFFKFILHKNRITTSRNHIFLGWQIISALILIIISMLFLKNQIKPIINLAKAAESFGKGQNIDDFKISGASEVKLAANEFLKMKDRILKQIDQRSLMLAGVSHDLKTPLTRMRLQTETIEKEVIKKSLNDEIQHMNEMLSEYLEFSSTEQQVKTGNINPVEAILKIKNDINFIDKHIEVEVTKSNDSLVNENIFNRIIINILNNSILYADHIKILIEMSSKFILIDIHDNGSGIPDDEKENVLKPFYRIDKSRNQNKANSGLGLSITKSLLSQINGTINLEDSYLGGLAVKIKIENQ